MSSGKKFMAVCGVMIAIGVVFTVTGFVMGGRVTGISFDSNGVQVHTPQNAYSSGGTGSYNYEKKTEDLSRFKEIQIDVDYADVKIEVSDHYGISYNMEKRGNFSYEVTGKKLVAKQDMSGNVVNGNLVSIGSIGGYQQEYVTVYIPAGSEFSRVEIENTSGDVTLSEFYAEELSLIADYGDVTMTNVGSENADITLNSGELDITDYEGDEFSVTADYGDVSIENAKVSAANLTLNSGELDLISVSCTDLKIESDYGDVDTRDVTTASAVLDLNSGSADLENFAADNIKVTVDYGDADIELAEKLKDYDYDLQTDYGTVYVGEKEMGESYHSLEEKQSKKIEVYCESGDVSITQK